MLSFYIVQPVYTQYECIHKQLNILLFSTKTLNNDRNVQKNLWIGIICQTCMYTEYLDRNRKIRPKFSITIQKVIG